MGDRVVTIRNHDGIPQHRGHRFDGRVDLSCPVSECHLTETRSDKARHRTGRQELAGKRLQRLTVRAAGDQDGDAPGLDAAVAGPGHE